VVVVREKIWEMNFGKFNCKETQVVVDLLLEKVLIEHYRLKAKNVIGTFGRILWEQN
jgi:hypothetical protein